MDTFSTRIIHRFQKYRERKLERIGKKLIGWKVSANLLTGLSLVFGLLSVYFLFSNDLLFIVFVLLHLLMDSFDGVVARLTKPTEFGDFLDHVVTDGLVTILPIVKIGWFLQDSYAYIAAVLYSLALLIHGFSKAPILFMRLFVVIALFVSLASPITNILLVVTYLSVAVAGAYSLARQLQWRLKDYHF